MRRCLFVIVVLALVVGLVGCSGTTTSGSDASGSAGSGSADSAGGKSSDDPYPGLDLETDGEKDALAIAESEEGRKWASGDFMNGTPVEGDARLVGYTFLVHDDNSYYQLRVMGGELVAYVGMGDDIVLSGSPYDPEAWRPLPPETDRQTEAWELVLAEVAKTNPGATQGGIESYVFFFPAGEDGFAPAVNVYSNRTDYSVFAMGGPWYQ